MTEAKSVTIKKSNAEQGANNTADFAELLAHHRAYFQSAATRSAVWRESQLILAEAGWVESKLPPS